MERDAARHESGTDDAFATFLVNAERRLVHEAGRARRLALITGAKSNAGRADGLDQAARILVDLINQ